MAHTCFYIYGVLFLFKQINSCFVRSCFKAVSLHGGVRIVAQDSFSLVKLKALGGFKGDVVFGKGIYYKQAAALVIPFINIKF